MADLSVIIPAYNEEAILGPVTQEALDSLEKSGLSSFELILVDDGSTDGTAAMARELCQRHGCVRMAAHGRNRGLGAALRTGFDAATGDIVTWIPGDGQFDLSEILAGLPLLHDCDVVLVLRRGRKEAARSLITFTYHTLIRLLFSFDATDLCGIYLLRRQLLADLQPQSDNIFYNLELPLLAVRHGKRIRRITVGLRPRRAGTSKVVNFTTLSRNLLELFRYRIGL